MDLDSRFLRQSARQKRAEDAPVITIADLFSGCGGLTLGLAEAIYRAGGRMRISLAVDIDATAGAVYQANFPESRFVRADLSRIFSGSPGEHLTLMERLVRSGVGPLDVLLGGPPCQGHSNLNNHTRRDDPKNELYAVMARAVEIMQPRFIAIENVPAVLRDRHCVVERTRSVIQDSGYEVADRIVDLLRVGIPQTRKRHLLIASKISEVKPDEVLQALETRVTKERTVRWAIGDLLARKGSSQLDTPTSVSETNQRRIQYLMDHNLFDLPDSERPDCHKEGDHSYKSMYGRLRWDLPSQTITTGYGSIGQGRFVHPEAMRPITPHEAARLQTFPDSFEWGTSTPRGKLATLIGNAVPPLLSLAIGETVVPALHRMSNATTVESSSEAATTRMKANRRRDTGPELALRQALHRLGLRYRVDYPPIEDSRKRADVVFKGAKVAVFVDGCFWHGCPIHGTKPKSNARFWEAKLTANRQRDEETRRRLEARGWVVVRVWEHEDPHVAAAGIRKIVLDRIP